MPLCGLDVHKDTVMGCVRIPDGEGGRAQEVREFRTFSVGLRALREWLAGHGVTQVAMEATGAYWKPVWHVLEAEPGWELLLANAQHVKNLPGRKSDAADAELIKAKTRVYPLADAADPPPLRFVNVSPEPYVVEAPGDYQYWDLLNEVVQSEPPESSDPVTLGMFAAIGIQHGKPFAPDERMRAILSEVATVGDATARATAYRFREREAYYYPDSAWRTVFFGGYQFQDHGVALIDSAAQLFFTGPGVSPAEEIKMVGAGSQYAAGFVDATGAPLDGGRTYRLHVPAHVPAKDFWSILVYDTQTRSMLQTDQEWPSVTSEDNDLSTNPDGSVDVYFAPEPPTDGHNWVQTLAGKGWWAMFRLYGPLEPWFDKTWRLPDIEPVR